MLTLICILSEGPDGVCWFFSCPCSPMPTLLFFFSIGDFPTVLLKMDGQIHVKQEPNAIMTNTFTIESNWIEYDQHVPTELMWSHVQEGWSWLPRFWRHWLASIFIWVESTVWWAVYRMRSLNWPYNSCCVCRCVKYLCFVQWYCVIGNEYKLKDAGSRHNISVDQQSWMWAGTSEDHLCLL